MNHSLESGEHGHPTPARYVAIALFLTVVTLIEVAIVYQEFLRSALIPLLLALSSLKFVLVAMFYMHLRFDHKLFSILFAGGMVLATCVLVALLTLFRVFFS